MTLTDPVSDLMNDHRRIEAVMNALEKKLNTEGPFPAEFVGRALRFFVEYADRFHHHKEEEQLFPAMAARGFPTEGGPIAVMLNEHEIGRKLLAGVRENLEEAGRGDTAAQAAVRTYASQYTEMLRQHIWKEDNILFAMARQVLDEPATRQLAERFAEGLTTNIISGTIDDHKHFAESI
jgi:hemerythrin-like domain-containing protein